MKDQDLYKQYCDNIKADIEAKSEERELMRDDQKFAAGDQWPDLIRKGREMSGRPIQTVNRLPAFIDQIVGDALVGVVHVVVGAVFRPVEPAV